VAVKVSPFDVKSHNPCTGLAALSQLGDDTLDAVEIPGRGRDFERLGERPLDCFLRIVRIVR
jgi:hypothetical protein